MDASVYGVFQMALLKYFKKEDHALRSSLTELCKTTVPDLCGHLSSKIPSSYCCSKQRRDCECFHFLA